MSTFATLPEIRKVAGFFTRGIPLNPVAEHKGVWVGWVT